jgi:hypothetical protein
MNCRVFTLPTTAFEGFGLPLDDNIERQKVGSDGTHFIVAFLRKKCNRFMSCLPPGRAAKHQFFYP